MSWIDFSVAGIRCLAKIGLIDTIRAVLVRSRHPLVKRIIGDKLEFRTHVGIGTSKVSLRSATTDWTVFHQIFVRGEYDIRIFKQNVWVEQKYNEIISKKKTPLIIDCGANIGLSANWFSSIFPQARIVSIELERENFVAACQNAVGNGNIQNLNAAVWGSRARLKLASMNADAHAFSASNVVDSDDQAPTIAVVTIDEISEANPDCELLMVKMDIEGAEVNVLSAGGNWARKVKLLAVELHDWLSPRSGSGKALTDFLHGRDFDFVLSGELCLIFFYDS